MVSILIVKAGGIFMSDSAIQLVNTVIQLKRDTASNWTSNNPVLAAGEMGIETDTNKFKFGDGSTAWNSLSYAGGGSSSSFKYGRYTLSADQTSHLAVGNHIEFDTYQGSLGGLSTGSGQENGIITLPAGKTYKITGSFGVNHSSAGNTVIQAYNRTASAFIGNHCCYISQNSGTTQSIQPTLLTIITPTVDTEIDIRFTIVTNTSILYNNYYSWLLIEEYGGV